MADLTADQRNYYYLLEAARTGIHKPILAALYEVHDSPTLTDGETGLGVAPANRIPPDQVNTFPEQVQYAANTVRSITNRLTAQGWKGDEIWERDEGRYTDRFVETIAKGYAPPVNDPTAARLESSNSKKLLNAYLEDLTVDYRADQLPHNLANLDPNLLTFTERQTRYYASLSYQREALLEAVRLWRKLDDREEAIASFNLPSASETAIDRALLQFIQQVSPNYSGYPHQREALLRLTQLWRQLDSREEAIATLQNHPTGETNLEIVDPAIIAFTQRIPKFYQGKGEQRNALTETFRLWNKLDSRATVLTTLGLNPQVLTASNPDRTTLVNAASQLDRELLEFVKRIPTSYKETDEQRESLLRLVQLWRGLDAREKTIQSLFEDLRRMGQSRRDSQDAPPIPEPLPPPPRPSRWTPCNVRGHMYTSIVPNGNFTWAEATHGGTRMPPNQATVDAIVRIAQLAQQARDRMGRPFRITSWYCPPEVNCRVGGASESRHIVGDAIDFYCDGLSGNQLYWALDPWWPGGLGRYQQFPELSHIDARGYRARWKH